MNCAAKGRRAERRSIELLQREGYACTRSAASKGPFDICAIGSQDILLVQVKATRWPSSDEMQAMRAVSCPSNCKKVIHRWRARRRAPDVREL